MQETTNQRKGMSGKTVRATQGFLADRFTRTAA